MADFPLEFLLQVKNEMGAGLSQASSQLKNVGSEATSTASKVKQSGIGIGAGIALITTQLVTTANSIISLNRQYQDLEKAQNNVKQSGFSLANAQGKLENATINLSKAQAGGGKASALDLKIAHTELAIAIDKYGKNSVQAAKAQSNLNKLQSKGTVDLDKVKKAQNNLERAQRGVTSATINQKESVVNLQRATQDFYLSTIPTAIGIIGSFASVLQVAKGSTISFGGVLTKLVLPLAAISAVAAAISTNFLGFRDMLEGVGKAIGDAVPQLKPFLELLEGIGFALGLTDKDVNLNKAAKAFQDSLKPIIDGFKMFIDTIMHGDWNKLFTMLRKAAIDAWEFIKKNVPILGDVENLVNKIKNGNWKGALLQIWKAAVDVWNTIKIAVPFLGDIENFIKGVITGIKTGKWDDAFKAIVDKVK